MRNARYVFCNILLSTAAIAGAVALATIGDAQAPSRAVGAELLAALQDYHGNRLHGSAVKIHKRKDLAPIISSRTLSVNFDGWTLALPGVCTTVLVSGTAKPALLCLEGPDFRLLYTAGVEVDRFRGTLRECEFPSEEKALVRAGLTRDEADKLVTKARAKLASAPAEDLLAMVMEADQERLQKARDPAVAVELALLLNIRAVNYAPEGAAGQWISRKGSIYIWRITGYEAPPDWQSYLVMSYGPDRRFLWDFFISFSKALWESNDVESLVITGLDVSARPIAPGQK
jgi:hypothetical protein